LIFEKFWLYSIKKKSKSGEEEIIRKRDKPNMRESHKRNAKEG